LKIEVFDFLVNSLLIENLMSILKAFINETHCYMSLAKECPQGNG